MAVEASRAVINFQNIAILKVNNKKQNNNLSIFLIRLRF